MPKPALPECRTISGNAHDAAFRQRRSLTVWFDPEMQWLSAPGARRGRPGRPARFSIRAIELCLTLRALFNLPLRQATGLVGTLLRQADLDWPVPDYTTLCRRQPMLPATLLDAWPGFGPLKLLVDSNGIELVEEAKWNATKPGPPDRRAWRKVRIGIDEKRADIQAVTVTANAIGDALVPPVPPVAERIGRVAGNGCGAPESAKLQ
ncbi:MAG: transposase [Novosphingobium sp.]